jgi:hypothetical protein
MEVGKKERRIRLCMIVRVSNPKTRTTEERERGKGETFFRHFLSPIYLSSLLLSSILFSREHEEEKKENLRRGGGRG